MIMKKLPGGVIAAVPTPVTDQGAPDVERFLEHCRWALGNGCDGLNVLGSTGEASSFGMADRRTIMEAAAANLDVTKLMVGTGLTDAASTVEMIRLAAELGFAVALVLPPYYYKPVTDDGLLTYFANLCDATGSTPIPLFLYNFPAMTGVPFSPELVVRMAQELDGRVCGIKDSSADIPYCKRLVAALPELRVFPSSETCLATAAADGFAGCISATTNLTGPAAGRVWQKSSYDGREDDVNFIADMRQQIAAQPLIPAVKYLVSLQQKNDPNFARVLPPFAPLNDDQTQALRSVADQLAGWSAR
jgi:4-hydroxy-tetrahydrodipicolinate synthase